jgi:3-oxoacyl-[acyl-carrier-protein] synthase II
MTGHLLGAAGGIEGVFSVLSLHRNILPPTINYVTPIPIATWTTCRMRPVKRKWSTALSNSLGFGGTNAALLFKRYRNRS